jgi:quercetin dioxygenase-like cupin family protein
MTALPNFVDWDTIAPRRLAPGVTLRVFSSDRVMLSLVDLEPGAVVPPHQHPHEQLGIWLAGDAEATIGDNRKHVSAGDCYYIPGGTEHTFVTGHDGGQALDIFHPPREDYLTP